MSLNQPKHPGRLLIGSKDPKTTSENNLDLRKVPPLTPVTASGRFPSLVRKTRSSEIIRNSKASVISTTNESVNRPHNN